MAHGLPTSHQPQSTSTSTTGGKDGATGWAAATSTTKVFLPFDQAHAYALALTLKSSKSGVCGARVAHGLPTSHRIQSESTRPTGGKGGATGWAAATRRHKVFLPFDQAHAYALSLTLKTQHEWSVWSKSGARPANIPSHPDRSLQDTTGGKDGATGWAAATRDQGVPAV